MAVHKPACYIPYFLHNWLEIVSERAFLSWCKEGIFEKFNPYRSYLRVNFSQTISDENIKNAPSKRILPHGSGSCISYFSVYNNCVEFSASGLGTGLNRDPFKAETTYSHDPSLTSHLSLGLIHPCTITALSMSMCSS